MKPGGPDLWRPSLAAECADAIVTLVQSVSWRDGKLGLTLPLFSREGVLGLFKTESMVEMNCSKTLSTLLPN
jgi:hypothetical protein